MAHSCTCSEWEGRREDMGAGEVLEMGVSDRRISPIGQQISVPSEQPATRRSPPAQSRQMA